MADNETPIAEEGTAAIATTVTPAGGGLMKKLMIGGGVLGLLAVGVFAGPAVQKMMSPADEVRNADPAAEAKGNDKAKAKTISVIPDAPEIYTGLHPAMVVNFRDALGEQHFMQLEMEVMAHEQKVAEAVKTHTALIRNNLILLYSNVSYEDIATRDGKEKMLADGLQEIQAVLAPRIGTPNAEALYFTSLIIQ